MNEEFQLKKWIWSEVDFEELGWHDCTIYAIAFQPETYEFSLDIDYIFDWIEPDSNESLFKFWVAPATLVFENIYNLEINLESNNGEVQIDDIIRENPKQPHNADYINRDQDWQWTINCHQGMIGFRSIGFKLYIRLMPQLIQRQILDTDIRKGYSFMRQRDR